MGILAVHMFIHLPWPSTLMRTNNLGRHIFHKRGKRETGNSIPYQLRMVRCKLTLSYFIIHTFVASFIVYIHTREHFLEQAKQGWVIRTQLCSRVYVVMHTIWSGRICIDIKKALYAFPKVFLYCTHSVGVSPQPSSLSIVKCRL